MHATLDVSVSVCVHVCVSLCVHDLRPSSPPDLWGGEEWGKPAPWKGVSYPPKWRHLRWQLCKWNETWTGV